MPTERLAPLPLLLGIPESGQLPRDSALLPRESLILTGRVTPELVQPGEVMGDRCWHLEIWPDWEGWEREAAELLGQDGWPSCLPANTRGTVMSVAWIPVLPVDMTPQAASASGKALLSCNSAVAS